MSSHLLRKRVVFGFLTSAFGLVGATSFLACESGESTSSVYCPVGQSYNGTKCVSPKRVAVNTVGFQLGATKRATLKGPATGFLLKRDGQVVLNGVITSENKDNFNNNTGEDKFAVADFSEFNEPGTYTVEAVGLSDVSPSYPFKIGDGVLDEVLSATVLGMTGLRCGTALSFKYKGDTFSHEKCHSADGDTSKNGGAVAGDSNGKLDLTGGWHDAGDYGKYVSNGAFAAGMMLMAWEHFPEKLKNRSFALPEQGGAIPDYLDEVQWELKWLFKMQFPDGSVSHKLTGLDFEGFMLPEADTQTRYMSPMSTVATADFVAVMAQADRIYREYDAAFADQCKDAALKGWAYLQAHPGNEDPSGAMKTSGYKQVQYTESKPTDADDDRVWAEAELWESYGAERDDALKAFEAAAPALGLGVNWDWGYLPHLGAFTYLFSKREGRNPDAQAKIMSTFQRLVDNSVANADNIGGYGQAYAGGPYWGIFGVHARTTLALGLASLIGPEEKRPDYVRALGLQVDHLLGRNYYSRSVVTGIGGNPPKSPHHRPSQSDSVLAPWPGLLIGGPSPKEGVPSETTWVDDWNDASTSEVAVNWNAPLIYGLVAAIKQ